MLAFRPKALDVAVVQGEVHNQPPTVEGGVHNQPPTVEGGVHNQPPTVEGGVHNQPPTVEGGVHNQPSKGQLLVLHSNPLPLPHLLQQLREIWYLL
jgi:hypothetical protein